MLCTAADLGLLAAWLPIGTHARGSMCSRYAAYKHAVSETEWSGDATAESGKGTLLVARCVKGHFHGLCGGDLTLSASQHKGVCLPSCDVCPEQDKLRSGTASCTIKAPCWAEAKMLLITVSVVPAAITQQLKPTQTGKHP